MDISITKLPWYGQLGAFVVLAAAFLTLGLLNMDFSRNWWSGQRDRLLVGVPAVTVSWGITFASHVGGAETEQSLMVTVPVIVVWPFSNVPVDAVAVHL